MGGLLPIVTAERNGLMPKLMAIKSLSIIPSPSNKIIKICRLYKFEITTILLQWGAFTYNTFNVAIVYLNNRSQNGSSTLFRSISRLNGSSNVYYKYDGDNVDIYIILQRNDYVRIDCAPIYNTNANLLLEESNVLESDLTPLF